MKKSKILISIIFITFALTSCTKYLDKMPDDQLTLEMVFNDKTRTEDWLAGIYSNIPDPYWGYTRSIGWDPLSDDMAPSTGWEQFGWTLLAKQTGNWNPTSDWDPNYWSELPKRIRSAYIFLEHVKPNAAQLVTEDEVNLMKAEARFMIAYYYSLLLETYGAIPFQLGMADPNGSEEELMLGQTPFDNVVKWIDQELLDLSAVLPASYTNTQKYGRATSIMCLAVRARLLLFAASPLVNGNSAYKSFVNNKGEAIYNATFDANKWAIATQASKLLIDRAEASGHKLYYEYNADGSIDPFMSYLNMMFRRPQDGNKEILFARPNSDFGEYDRHAQPRGTGGNGGLGITQSLVDAFYMENGRTINDPLSGYREKGFSTANEIRNTQWAESKGGGIVTLQGTFNMYTHREPRFYISVLYNGAWFRRENRTTEFYLGSWDGGPTHDAPQNGYLVRKKVHPDYDPRNGTNPYRPGILYRLGEAYLNYAEALNESNPGHADILKYLNLIRERGGIPQYGTGPSALPVPSSQEQVRQAIRQERRVELNNEGIRYRDIRRWKIGEQTINGNFYGMNFSGTEKDDNDANPKAFFKRSVYQKRLFSEKNYWFPVPQSEIDKNKNLVQNPFWD
ncbi:MULTISPECIES: RagB/SusD family nutrient uptake outer membrane protein [unclassified Sphingobacterium]|uniref:RagB/SusD family nutrient uptake outer membrane protein n=1 Tax=unclassified Sphingobacterium TaxID=2609468 RepID=UPI00143B670D|nr:MULTISPECIES: RagB/SusD family nutrient uptake outer membrane protein [unclassified Sphingobacterium]NJI71889.1 RagB/SusD family nutrient uptake outer membrane protein [Sphingobacterium sp. B16(2022)]QQD13470.1 RagB/SusD family nutrient uptake outer membrane protein [Sphingobacterium sp. UDSM-2020]